MKKSIAIGIMLLLLMASIIPIVNAGPKRNKEEFSNHSPIRLLGLPQPKPFIPFTAFTLTFYQSSSTIFNLTLLDLLEINIMSSIFDSSNDPVGKLEYLKITGGALTTVDFENYMTVGIIALGTSYDDSNFDKETGIGYITGTAIFLGYIGR
jgi:hypothetical protein